MRQPAFLILVLVLIIGCGGTTEPETSTTPPEAPAQVNKSDYVTTTSGLKYYDLKTGSGPSPQTGQNVDVHYTGWLANGKMFDSSLKRGKTFTFELGAGRVIKGWDEGVASMQVGTLRQLVIPPEKAYGAPGRGSIPPNATLIFQVELLEIR